MLFGGVLLFGWLCVCCDGFTVCLVACSCVFVLFGYNRFVCGLRGGLFVCLCLRLLYVVVDLVIVGLWLRSGFTCSWLRVG